MSDLVKCGACNGQKRIMGMGMMKKDCKACKGVGWLEKEEEKEEKDATPTIGDVLTRKRRGPKPGYKKVL